MPVVQYNPFRNAEEVPEGFRFFHDAVNSLLSESTSRPWTPAVDILETENDLVLQADLPGVEMNNIDIKIENGTLSLKGERTFGQEKNHKGFHRIERGYGTFTRYFTLPDTVDTEKVQAQLNSGVLTITLPKKEVAKPKTIKVQVSNNS
jgi:HSP20 family protein